VRAGYCLHIARIDAHVVDTDRLRQGDGRTDEAVSVLDPQRARHVFRVPNRVGNRQLPGLAVDQVDRERLEFRDPSDDVRDLLEQRIEIEHGRHFAAKREEHRRRFDRDHPRIGHDRRGGFGHGLTSRHGRASRRCPSAIFS
jgi:hypothetical protein